MTKPKNPKHLSFETAIVLRAALCTLPSFLTVLSLLVYFDAEWEMWVTCLSLTIAPFPFMAWNLTHWISSPLRVATNVISSIREGDFTLRGRRTSESYGSIVELYDEINAIAAIMDKERISSIETQKIVEKITVNIDVATLIVNADRVVTRANNAAVQLIASINQSETSPQQKTVDELKVPFILDQSTQDFSRFSYVHEGRRFEGRRGLFMLEGERYDLILLTDITRATNEQERESWKRLLRVLGHELNNSIAPISSLSSTLSKITRNSEIDTETKTDILDGLESITSRSKNIVSFMSDYTRLAKLPEPQVENIPLAPVLQTTCQLFSDVVTLSENLPNPTVSIDRAQFEQALVNLLKNAKEAGSQKPGSIHCSVKEEGGKVTIDIEDDGQGITNPDNLFVPFYTTKTKGSGIGLVLSKQIIESIGGTLSLNNKESSPGCRASIRLKPQP